MADATKEYQLLADGILLDGVEYKRGDTIRIPKDHGDVLEAHGSVGAPGTLERQAKAEEQAQKLRDEAAKAPEPGGEGSDVAVRRGPGRPPKAQD